MTSNKGRTEKAIEAMQQMGIQRSRTMPVLKKLLKVCENSWEHIEADDYWLLAEAIFEADIPEEKQKANNKRGAAVKKELKSERKRQRRGQEDPERSPPLASPEMLKSEIKDSPVVKTLSPDPFSAKYQMNSRKYAMRRKHTSASTSRQQECLKESRNGDESTVLIFHPLLTTPMAEEVQSQEEYHQTSCQSEDISTIGQNHQIILDHIRKGRAIEKCRKASEESATTSLREPPSDSDDPVHDTDDICKGEEVVNIPIINDFPGERCPAYFMYISQSIVHRNASLDFSLSQLHDDDCCSDCFGNCLEDPLPCVCARETGGEFAYTLGGLLKTKFLDECIALRRCSSKSCKVYCKDCPLQRDRDSGSPKECKGHLPRKFIKECWKKCGCHKQCDNRVVQQGIWCDLQVFWTPNKGWGLRSTCDLPKGAFVCEYVGEVMTCEEFYERAGKMGGNWRHTYPIILDSNWASEGSIKKENALCLDGTFYGNVARFINHQCFDANLVDIPIEIETTDRHFYHVAFFTTRKIDAYEELTWDYGIHFDKDEHLVKVFQCQCDSDRCRDKSRPAGSKRVSIEIS